MQITSKFTIGIHILAALEYFKNDFNVTSNFLAGSVGANPVLIRTVMGELKNAGLIYASQGKTGINLAKSLSDITFYDVYKALDCVEENALFHFHESPSVSCPVGKNIHCAMDNKLSRVQTVMENEMKKITVKSVYDDIENRTKKFN